jgi:hypothetical protein
MTPTLKRSLIDLYYMEACDQRGGACASLESIVKSSPLNDNVIAFRKGFHKIMVRVPRQTIQKIAEVAKSGAGFDYLVCNVGQKDHYDGTIVANPLALCWVKVETGRGTFSDGQIDALERIKLDVAVFCIRDVLAPPGKIEIEWDVRSGRVARRARLPQGPGRVRRRLLLALRPPL